MVQKLTFNRKTTSDAAKIQRKLLTELQDARERGEVEECVVNFKNACEDLHAGKTLESSWTYADTCSGNPSGTFRLQMYLSRVDEGMQDDRSKAAWRLSVRVKTFSITSVGEDYDAYWAARIVLQVGSGPGVCLDCGMTEMPFTSWPGTLCTVIPDHRSPEGPKAVREVCIGKVSLQDYLLTEICSTGALQLSAHIAIRDAGGPVAGTKLDLGCGCC
jgi:hypothetical protein